MKCYCTVYFILTDDYVLLFNNISCLPKHKSRMVYYIVNIQYVMYFSNLDVTTIALQHGHASVFDLLTSLPKHMQYYTIIDLC